MGEGKECRHVWADWAVARDARRSSGSAESAFVVGSGWKALSGRNDEDDGFRRGASGELSEPVHEFAAGRHYFYGHAAGNRWAWGATARSSGVELGIF